MATGTVLVPTGTACRVTLPPSSVVYSFPPMVTFSCASGCPSSPVTVSSSVPVAAPGFGVSTFASVTVSVAAAPSTVRPAGVRPGSS